MGGINQLESGVEIAVVVVADLGDQEARGVNAAAVGAAHAKKFSTRVTESGIASCMQVMGANGARRDHPLPRHLAASRLTHYVDGATEIQDVVISRSLLD